MPPQPRRNGHFGNNPIHLVCPVGPTEYLVEEVVALSFPLIADAYPWYLYASFSNIKVR
jgi:hypothetical protein